MLAPSTYLGTPAQNVLKVSIILSHTSLNAPLIWEAGVHLQHSWKNQLLASLALTQRTVSCKIRNISRMYQYLLVSTSLRPVKLPQIGPFLVRSSVLIIQPIVWSSFLH